MVDRTSDGELVVPGSARVVGDLSHQRVVAAAGAQAFEHQLPDPRLWRSLVYGAVTIGLVAALAAGLGPSPGGPDCGRAPGPVGRHPRLRPAASTGLSPGEGFLFSGTIADNIRFGRPEATRAEVEAAAAAAARAVGALAGQGITIAIDDFGKGYTSLSQLRTLPITELKIDRTFLVELQHDERNRAIVRSIIGLANGLGCHVTAEGVESPDIAAWLAAAGCQCAQGFLFSKPLPCEELVNRYRQPADTENVHRQQPLTSLEGSWT